MRVDTLVTKLVTREKIKEKRDCTDGSIFNCVGATGHSIFALDKLFSFQKFCDGNNT